MVSYDRGDAVRLGNHVASGAAAFKNAAGVDADPTTVTLTVTGPGQAATIYVWPTPGFGQVALVKEAVGRFYADVTVTGAPRVYYRLAGTGAVTAAAEGELIVNYPRIA